MNRMRNSQRLSTPNSAKNRSAFAFEDLQKAAAATEDLQVIYKTVIRSPLYTPTPSEQQKIWEYRSLLVDDHRALSKFIYSVNWDDEYQVSEAERLIPQWSNLAASEVLQLLMLGNRKARRLGVLILARLSNYELEEVLLQLVQALRLEKERPVHNELCQFLIQKATESLDIAIKLEWFFGVEDDDPDCGERFKLIHFEFFNRMRSSSEEYLDMIIRQQKLIKNLTKLYTTVRNSGMGRQKKQEWLKQELQDDSQWAWSKDVFTSRQEENLMLPLGTSPKIRAFRPDKTTIFKSAREPFGLAFETQDNKVYRCIYKCGDDLRQDQLIMQQLQIMDRLLRDEGINMGLTLYRVIATSIDSGFVEIVENATNISSIIKEHGDIQRFFQHHHPNSQEPFGIEPQVMDNFVKSCAGYCAVTYILGIGDRHLDNLLITTSGLLFHIDFGFILGKDPKPFPPPIRICKEMVDAMGGYGSDYHSKFKILCVRTFLVLRQHAHFLITLFMSMCSALPGLSYELLKSDLETKFMLHLSDFEATTNFLAILGESEKAFTPQVTELLHKVSQSLKE
eukprot:gb/GECH01006318.1/.p1 GENE.gb/GECH01006318.1/~~gb/GECH01006318.1/.p1  ORF type:complete len:565 (+),score=103.84 gb/GECH01006318.1/:1-1695(+)